MTDKISLAFASHAAVVIQGWGNASLVLANRKLLPLRDFHQFVQEHLVMVVQDSILLALHKALRLGTSLLVVLDGLFDFLLSRQRVNHGSTVDFL